jgi:hypothetical protein
MFGVAIVTEYGKHNCESAVTNALPSTILSFKLHMPCIAGYSKLRNTRYKNS